jgi:hypothetical protein
MKGKKKLMLQIYVEKVVVSHPLFILGNLIT